MWLGCCFGTCEMWASMPGLPLTLSSVKALAHPRCLAITHVRSEHLKTGQLWSLSLTHDVCTSGRPKPPAPGMLSPATGTVPIAKMPRGGSAEGHSSDPPTGDGPRPPTSG